VLVHLLCVQVTELEEENSLLRKRLDTTTDVGDRDMTSDSERQPHSRLDNNANLHISTQPDSIKAAEQQVVTLL